MVDGCVSVTIGRYLGGGYDWWMGGVGWRLPEPSARLLVVFARPVVFRAHTASAGYKCAWGVNMCMSVSVHQNTYLDV